MYFVFWGVIDKPFVLHIMECNVFHVIQSSINGNAKGM